MSCSRFSQAQIQYIQITDYNDTLIHNSCDHPIQHKLAAFRTMIHRLNNTPLHEKDYKDELNTIKYLAESNGYDRTIAVSYTHLDVYKRQ